MLVAGRLTKLAASDTPSPDSNRAVVMPFSMIEGDDLPTVAPQAVLWARHQHVFAGETWAENKERYYQYLYYMNLNENWLNKSLKDGDFVSMIALFGWGRHTTRLNAAAKPLTGAEIDEESARFGDYLKNFSFQQASHPTLSYITVPVDWSVDFTNLDKWYDRDAGETVGKYILYKVKLKPPQ